MATDVCVYLEHYIRTQLRLYIHTTMFKIKEICRLSVMLLVLFIVFLAFLLYNINKVRLVYTFQASEYT